MTGTALKKWALILALLFILRASPLKAQGATWGSGNNASGYVSTAFGNGTTASGNNSTSFGIGTTASGYGSTSFGYGTTASWYCSTAFGNYSTSSGGYSWWAFSLSRLHRSCSVPPALHGGTILR